MVPDRQKVWTEWTGDAKTISLRLRLGIIIYHECESSIEKSVPRITVWHHEACRVMTNGDPKGMFFFYLTLT